MNGAPRSFDDLPTHTTDLCLGITALDQGHALAETTALLDPALWAGRVVDPRWWVIGLSGPPYDPADPRDQWLLGPDELVWWWANTPAPRVGFQFQPMGISVRDWLVLGHLVGQAEALTSIDDDQVWVLDERIESISPGLGKRYPYVLPFADAPDSGWMF